VLNNGIGYSKDPVENVNVSCFIRAQIFVLS